MPVESLVLASRLYVFSNVMSLQTPDTIELGFCLTYNDMSILNAFKMFRASVGRQFIASSYSEVGRIHTCSGQQLLGTATYSLIQSGVPPIGLHAQHGCTASGSSPYPCTSAIAVW